jgi:tetratricopeptide (TPR) repeat protein
LGFFTQSEGERSSSVLERARMLEVVAHMAPSTPRWLAPAFLIVAVTLVTHASDVGNGFVWDDASIVVENPATRDLAQLGHVLLSPDETPPYYRPLNRASYLLDYQLFGMDPRGFHAVNVLLQAACALAMYALGRRLFEARWPALLAGLLLAVHPVHVEAVAFVSARNNLFALLFALVSLALFIDAARLRSWARAVLSACAFFLALASKEQGAMVLPLLAAWLALPIFPGRLAGKGRWALLLPHAGALLAYVVLRTVSLGGPVASPGILAGLGSRLALNCYVIPAYLRLVVFPRDLTPFHELPAGFASLWWLPLAWTAILAALAYFIRRPSLASSVGLLWCGLNLLPIINVIPIPSTVMAERFFHASAAGLWLVAADAAWRLSRVMPRRVLAVAAAVLLAVLGTRTVLRNRDWHDDVALFQSAVRAEPASVLAHFNLGVALKDTGDLEAARREWEAALAIRPDDPGTHAQLGTLLAVRGDLPGAELHYRAALRGNPGLAEARFNLGRICERTGRVREARELYQALLEAPPAAQGGLGPRARERLGALAGGR